MSLLGFNEKTVLFVRHPDSPNRPQVVQIWLRYSDNLPLYCGGKIAFYLAQKEITNTIKSLVLLSLTKCEPFPSPSLIRGDNYSLIVETKEWIWAEDIRFLWGEDEVQASPLKWIVTFVPDEL